MTSSPTSLRDLYSAQQRDSPWSFTPPPINATVAQPAPVTPQFKWTTRPAQNSIFDLSPDLNEASGVNVVDLLRTIGASAVLQYTSTAIAMPWEVGKLLLQVQWIPRDADANPVEEVEDDDLSSEDNDEPDSFFADPDVDSTPKITHTRPVDRRPSVHIQGGLPDHTLPVGCVDSVWGMIKRLGRFRAEGWLALWKGLLTSCITEIVSSSLQPIIHNVLRSFFLPTTLLSHHPPILLPIASHLIIGFILSPLDLIRTRLIVQSFTKPNYTGPLDAFLQIYRNEGGLHGMYLHPQLLFPTLIDNALRPIVSLALPSMLVAYLGFHITEDSNPLAWGFAELASSCLGLLITLPFETVRRRLQVQVRGTAKSLNGCVQLRPAPYNGIVDAMWHILTEERSDLPLITRPRKRRASTKGKEKEEPQTIAEPEEGDSWGRHTGIGQLYRGLGMRLSASVIVFLLSLVSGEDDSGWAEL